MGESQVVHKGHRTRIQMDTAVVPEGYSGPILPVECHKCGMGIGASLGRIAIPEHLKELLLRGQLSCPHCGLSDLTLVKITDKIRDEMDRDSLRAALAKAEEANAAKDAELLELRQRFASNQSAPPVKADGPRPPSRGQHKE